MNGPIFKQHSRTENVGPSLVSRSASEQRLDPVRELKVSNPLLACENVAGDEVSVSHVDRVHDLKKPHERASVSHAPVLMALFELKLFIFDFLCFVPVESFAKELRN